MWVALKRDEPTLKFSDLDDRNIGDFDFEDDPRRTTTAALPTRGELSTSDPSTDSA